MIVSNEANNLEKELGNKRSVERMFTTLKEKKRSWKSIYNESLS